MTAPSLSEVDQAEVAALRSRIGRIRDRIAAACRKVGRREEEVTVVAVSKTFPPPAVVAAIEAGIVDFGENRVQELVSKAAVVPGIRHGGAARWHLVGHLQRNKAKDVVQVADLFHALDNEKLARELSGRAERIGIVLPCLIQVNTSGEQSKSGIAPGDVSLLLDEIEDLSNLRMLGFMTIARPVDDPELVRAEFRMLRDIRDRTASAHPRLELELLSMGMSQDFEVAIEEGATHVRIGSAIFGDRWQGHTNHFNAVI